LPVPHQTTLRRPRRSGGSRRSPGRWRPCQAVASWCFRFQMLSPNALYLATCLASAPSVIDGGAVSSRSRSRRVRHVERNSGKWQRGRLFSVCLGKMLRIGTGDQGW
jgi:hypothetical protein